MCMKQPPTETPQPPLNSQPAKTYTLQIFSNKLLNHIHPAFSCIYSHLLVFTVFAFFANL